MQSNVNSDPTGCAGDRGDGSAEYTDIRDGARTTTVGHCAPVSIVVKPPRVGDFAIVGRLQRPKQMVPANFFPAAARHLVDCSLHPPVVAYVQCQ